MPVKGNGMVGCTVYENGSMTGNVFMFPIVPRVGDFVTLRDDGEEYQVAKVQIYADGIPELGLEANPAIQVYSPKRSA